MLYSFDPIGIDESANDGDNDGLTNLQEQAAGTNPLIADTDSDGFNDGDEILAGSDPLNAESIPDQMEAAVPIPQWALWLMALSFVIAAIGRRSMRS